MGGEGGFGQVVIVDMVYFGEILGKYGVVYFAILFRGVYDYQW